MSNTNDKLTHRQGILLVLLLTALCIGYWLGDIALHANSKVIEPWGDGYKAYTVVLYHVEHDTSYRHFAGMNYPYGEHVVPGAAEPLLSNPMRFIDRYLFDIKPYGLGILHYSLLLGFLLCGLFLYLIFRRLGLPVVYSALAAAGITFLSPQLTRMEAHYSLAHVEALPIVLYLLMRFDERPSWRWSMWIAFVVWCYALLHFYFFAILAFAIGGYFGFRFLQDWAQGRALASLPGHLMHFGVQLLLPLAFFVFWMSYNDPVSDRTPAPWGFFAYRAHPSGVFASLKQPHFQWIDQHLFHLRHVDIESQAYIGLLGVLATLALLVFWARKRAQQVLPAWPTGHQRWLSAITLMAAAVLLFAFGLPFILPGLSGLLDYAGPIRQFRSIGRFVWVYFYVINIVAFVWLYYYLAARPVRRVLFPLAFACLGLEMAFFASRHNLSMDSIEEFVPGERFTDVEGVDYRDFQAALPIPYYNIGSDNFWVTLSGFIGQKSQTLSWQTGLPLTGALLTRSSLSQTINQVQLVTEPYRPPLVLDDYPDRRPLLLLWDAERATRQDSHLLEGASLIYERPPLQFYRLPLASFDERIRTRIAAARRGWADSTLVAAGSLRTNGAPQSIVQQSWPDGTAEGYQGKGMKAEMQALTILCEARPDMSADTEVSLTFWMYIGADRYPRTDFVATELQEDGSPLWQDSQQIHQLVRAIDNNGWALIAYDFKATAPQPRLRFTLQNKDLGDLPLRVDELLLRPAAQDCYERREGWLMKNNRWWADVE